MLTNTAEKLDACKRERTYAKAIALRVRSWTLADGDGKSVDVSAANIAKIRPAMQYKLTNIVLGLAANDIDPNWTESDKAEVTQAEIDAAIAGTPIGTIMEEANGKNSEAG